jgi:hypothetical protein
MGRVAVRESVTLAGRAQRARAAGRSSVRYSARGDGIVRVEVTDRTGPGTPELRPAGRDAEGGRGLQLVAGLAARRGGAGGGAAGGGGLAECDRGDHHVRHHRYRQAGQRGGHARHAAAADHQLREVLTGNTPDGLDQQIVRTLRPVRAARSS